MAWQIHTADLNNAENLGARFKSNTIVGAIMFGHLPLIIYFNTIFLHEYAFSFFGFSLEHGRCSLEEIGQGCNDDNVDIDDDIESHYSII